MDVSIISWNIWKGKHTDKVIAFLKEQNADIVCLQEIMQQEIEGMTYNTATTIAQALGYQNIYFKSFTTDRHTPVFDLGDAILTRFPIVSSSVHALSSMEEYKGNSVTEPRNAIEATLDLHGTELTILNTHLGYSEGFTESTIRTQQTEKLLKLIQNPKTILAGDFNSLPKSSVIKSVSELMNNTDIEMTKPTYFDLKDSQNTPQRIDYVFLSRDIKTRSFEIIESSASDHFPLKVVVSVGE